MTKQKVSSKPTFKFHCGDGRPLVDRIAELEALATRQLRKGVSPQSVLTGAHALLRVALDGARGSLSE